MKSKEQVIVFDGEDKFISPKGNPKEGKLSAEGERFKRYMLQQNSPLVIPQPGDDDFCEKAEKFIKTNCDGKATPAQVWEVHELFQKHCLKKDEEASADGEKVTSDVLPTDKVEFPDFTKADCKDLAELKKKYEDFMMSARMPMDVLAQYKNAIEDIKAQQAKRCALESPKLPADADVKPPFISLSNPKIGLPPGSIEPAEQPAKAEKKDKTGLLLLIAAALVGIYFLTKQKK